MSEMFSSLKLLSLTDKGYHDPMNQVTKLLLRKYIVLTPLKVSFRCCCKLRCKDVLFYPSTKRLLGFIQEERKHKGKDNVFGFLNFDCCSIRSQENLKFALFFAQTNQLIDQYSRSKNPIKTRVT